MCVCACVHLSVCNGACSKQVWGSGYSLVNSLWRVCVCTFRLTHIYSGIFIYLFWFVGKSGHASCSVCLSNVISAHIIPIWQYSMAAAWHAQACDRLFDMPLCRLVWCHAEPTHLLQAQAGARGELIGGEHEEKGIGPGVWRGMASKNLLNYCPQNCPECKQGCDGVWGCVCFQWRLGEKKNTYEKWISCPPY